MACPGGLGMLPALMWSCSLTPVRASGNGCTYCRRTAPPVSAGPSSSSQRGLGGETGGRLSQAVWSVDGHCCANLVPLKAGQIAPKFRGRKAAVPTCICVAASWPDANAFCSCPTTRASPTSHPTTFGTQGTALQQQCSHRPGAAASQLSLYLKARTLHLPAWKTAESSMPAASSQHPPRIFISAAAMQPPHCSSRARVGVAHRGIAPAPRPRCQPVLPGRGCPPCPARRL